MKRSPCGVCWVDVCGIEKHFANVAWKAGFEEEFRKIVDKEIACFFPDPLELFL
jgi:hypothetical protein